MQEVTVERETETERERRTPTQIDTERKRKKGTSERQLATQKDERMRDNGEREKS